MTFTCSGSQIPAANPLLRSQQSHGGDLNVGTQQPQGPMGIAQPGHVPLPGSQQEWKGWEKLLVHFFLYFCFPKKVSVPQVLPTGSANPPGLWLGCWRMHRGREQTHTPHTSPRKNTNSTRRVRNTHVKTERIYQQMALPPLAPWSPCP